MNTLLVDWALHYAGLNWPVLPLHAWTGTHCTCGKTPGKNDDQCHSPAKHPRTRNGLKDATTHPDIAWCQGPCRGACQPPKETT